mmetsp:Transcript_104737/g.312866  ORF Transcript_104737/g.312866 Transcript_104737/m.312866 type:complete len:464 (+) Transcript_104737:185-1576(+)
MCIVHAGAAALPHANASANAVMGGSVSGEQLFPSEQAVLVWLHDVRGFELGSEEKFSCDVSLEETQNVAEVTQSKPALLTLDSSSSLDLGFRTFYSVEGCAEDGRTIGGICLPLEFVARTCGYGLLRTWFPLGNWHQSVAAGTEGSQSSSGSAYTFRQFDRALRKKWPIACLSLLQVDSSLFDRMHSLVDSGPSEEYFSFSSVWQSHEQHASLLRALYRHTRSFRPQQPESPRYGSEQAGLPEPSRPAAPADRAESDLSSSLQTSVQDANGSVEEAASSSMSSHENQLSRLQQEITLAKRRAQLRCGHVDNSIHRLEGKLEVEKSEYWQLRAEIAEFRLEAGALQDENADLILQIEEGLAAKAKAREEELLTLRQQVEQLTEQKTRLVSMMERHFAARKEASQEPPEPQRPEQGHRSRHRAAQPAAPSEHSQPAAPSNGRRPAEPEERPARTLLPHPSELLNW